MDIITAKRLALTRQEKYTVSPYCVTTYSGRYYPLEVAGGYSGLSIWQLELNVAVLPTLETLLQNRYNTNHKGGEQDVPCRGLRG